MASFSQNTAENHLRKKSGRTRVTDLRILVENGLLATGGRLLKTPTAQLSVNGGSQHPDKRRAGGHGPTLADQVEHELLLVNGIVEWGPYAQAVLRWQQVLGRMVPCPLEPGRNGKGILSTEFVEWMMGLPRGMVTSAMPRQAQLRVLGNGVVPQQGYLALATMWPSYQQAVTRA